MTTANVINGKEAVIILLPDRVIKQYTQRYYELNEKHERMPEAYWYMQRPIPMMPRLLDFDAGSIVLARAGDPIKLGGYPPNRRRPPVHSGLREWLADVRVALDAAGVQHRDIHPGNILHQKGAYSLIDWSWATRVENPRAVPGLRSDADAIELLSAYAGWRRDA